MENIIVSPFWLSVAIVTVIFYIPGLAYLQGRYAGEAEVKAAQDALAKAKKEALDLQEEVKRQAGIASQNEGWVASLSYDLHQAKRELSHREASQNTAALNLAAWQEELTRTRAKNVELGREVSRLRGLLAGSRGRSKRKEKLFAKVQGPAQTRSRS
jgi:hypothetical protein